MIPIFFEGFTAAEVLRDALTFFISDDVVRSAPRGIETRESQLVTYILLNPAFALAWLPERRLNYSFAVAEWLWISSGRQDVEGITSYCTEIAKFSDDGRIFFGAYGPRWYEQVPTAIAALRRDPATRQAVVTMWRQNPPPNTKDVPCTLAFQFLIRDDKLRLLVTMRSSDVWLGLPYDLFNFAQLQAEVAAELRIKRGPLVITVGSAHLYERDVARARQVVEACKHVSVDTIPHLCNFQVALPPLRGRVPPARMRLWERAARLGAVADSARAEAEWLVPYLSVLAYREHKLVDLVEGPLSEYLRRDAR